MRICILGSANSVHTERWAKALHQAGHDIMVISLYEGHIEGVLNVILPRTSKAFYITKHFAIKKAIRQFKPDILHAHHASSYGFLGALLKFHPFVISVWGYDVMIFPQKTPIHKMFIKFALAKADYLTATSKALADASKQLSGKTPQVIPFGVAPEFFEVSRDYNRQELTIGIIKDLRPVYGIADLIKATALLIEKKYSIKLVIIGEGNLKNELIELSESLGIREYVIIKNRIPHSQIKNCLLDFDIFAMPSYSEGFGVAAVEAMATGLPVVTSSVGGIPEIVVDGLTGILIKPGDIEALSEALELYILDSELRAKHGGKGKEEMTKKYLWKNNVKMMLDLYDGLMAEKYLSK